VSKQITTVGQAMRSGGAMAGSSLGASLGPLGSIAGGILGGAAGGLISQWSGNGDYRVSSNSVLSAKRNIADFNKNSQSIVVRHREFIGSIRGSNAFSVQYELPLNPGLSRTFPWLAPIAGKFQQYKIKGMVFQYLPTSGTFNGTTPALGTVMLQTTYRSTDRAPLSKVEMLNEYWSNEIVASNTMLHAIECDPKENPFAIHYVRNSPITSGEPLMYDTGKTFVAVQGMTTDEYVGDLWVTYEVELKKPLVASDVVIKDDSYVARWGNTYTSSDFFTGPIIYSNGSTECTFAGRSIYFPNIGVGRNYYIDVLVSGTNLTNGGPWGMSGFPSYFGGAALGSALPTESEPILATVTRNFVPYRTTVYVPANSVMALISLPTIGFGSGVPQSLIVTIVELD
jgi:hypothetical protein